MLARRAPLHLGHDAAGDADGVARRRAAQHQHKFVAALAAGHVVRAQAFQHRAADQAQRAVTGGVAEKFVDALEVIDVKGHQHGRARFALAQRLVGQGLEVAAVGHLGQRIQVGQRAQTAA